MLEEIFSSAGFELKKEDLDRFHTYLKLLKKWNRVHKLTSITDDREIAIKHFLDSLSLVRAFEDLKVEWRGKSIADVGSGAGFPGVPMKIALKDFDLTLIESVGKKCSFLEYLKVSLQMDWKVLCKRAEEVKERYHIVVARALGEFEEIAPLLEGLSKGYVFVLKGSQIKEAWLEEMGYKAWEVKLPPLPKTYILWKKV